jgi:hypothetical protein
MNPSTIGSLKIAMVGVKMVAVAFPKVDSGVLRSGMCSSVAVCHVVRDWVVENHGEYPPRPIYFTCQKALRDIST